MPAIDADVNGVRVVVKGRFNPAIFSPAWLSSEAIIGPTEYADSDVQLITSEVSVMRCGWMHTQVTTDALQIWTLEIDRAEQVRDAAVAILRTLPHTPLLALGINREAHFRVRSIGEYHAIGHALAPKELWLNVLRAPATRKVSILGERDDDQAGSIQVDVEPSMMIPQAIFVGVNDHFDLSQPSSPQSLGKKPEDSDTAWAVQAGAEQTTLEPTPDRLPAAIMVLETKWHASQLRADRIVETVAAIGKEQKK